MASQHGIVEERNAKVELDTTKAQLQALQKENALLKEKKLGQAKASIGDNAVTGLSDIPFMNQGKNYLTGYVSPSNTKKRTYHETIKIVRWFYENDPIAGTVINRMADMAITTIRNRKKTKTNKQEVDEDVQAFYDALAIQLKPYLKIMALEFLLHGMVIPDYTTIRMRGDKIAEQLGRKRYMTIDKIWIRNPENIVLKRRPIGMERQVFLKVPNEEVAFITSKGKRPDGSEDKEAYRELVENFPEYVAAIQSGKTTFPLDNVQPIYRKQTSYDDYPIPYLQNALRALQHKEYLKSMDRSIASRTIEAIRHIKVGDKDFPADQDDIDAVQTLVQQNTSSNLFIYNLFTNHTVAIEWIVFPAEALLNEAKYNEPNSDIFLGLGFPRILTVGETAKSNAADNKIASIGPKATLEDLRDALIVWLKKIYLMLADLNNFSRIPDPYLAPISTTDITALIQFAIEALNAGAISKDTVAQLYQSDYQTEAGQIETEIEMDIPSPIEQQVQKSQEFQMQQTKMNQEFQSQQSDKAAQQQTQNNNNKSAQNNKG